LRKRGWEGEGEKEEEEEVLLERTPFNAKAADGGARPP